MAEGYWKVRLFYNGRLDGGGQVVEAECEEHGDPHTTMQELQRQVMRKNGAVFINGWSVDWIEDLEGQDRRVELVMMSIKDGLEEQPGMVGPSLSPMEVKGGIGRMVMNHDMVGAFTYEITVRAMGKNKG